MPEIYYQLMTITGYQEIESQITKLKSQRPTLVARLKAARTLGDLSENTEYSTAKRDLRHIDSRLRFLNKQLKYAKVIEPTDSKIVEIGTKVVLADLSDQEEMIYQVVGRQEADVNQGKISYESPLGSAIMHQSVGKIVTVNAPDFTYQVKIIKIELV